MYLPQGKFFSSKPLYFSSIDLIFLLSMCCSWILKTKVGYSNFTTVLREEKKLKIIPSLKKTKTKQLDKQSFPSSKFQSIMCLLTNKKNSWPI